MNPLARAELARRAARGAVLLDSARPGWADEIDIGTLAMETCDACVLGQLWGEYLEGFQAALRTVDGPRRMFSAASHGFTLLEVEQQEEDPDVLPRFAALAEAWRAEIHARIGGAPCPAP